MAKILSDAQKKAKKASDKRRYKEKRLCPEWVDKERERGRIYAAKRYAKDTVAMLEKAAKWRTDNPEKAKASYTNYRKNNPEKVKQSNSASYKANPEKMKACVASWQKRNAEKVKADHSVWSKRNSDKTRIHKQNRRALVGDNRLSSGIVKKLHLLQKGKCACCNADLSKIKYHLDHIMPLVLGGTNEDLNMQILCSTCNLSKHAKHPIDFMQSRGFLL